MTAESTFADFVRDRGPALYRYGFVLTGNRHDADDLVQDALIRLRGAWDRVERQDDPTGYVRTTMARLHISAWRRRKREWLTSSVPDAPIDDERLATAGDAGADSVIWQLLAMLPPRQRAVVVLRYYERLTDEEIATTLGVSRGTIRSQAFRALEKLRAEPQLIQLTGGRP